MQIKKKDEKNGKDINQREKSFLLLLDVKVWRIKMRNALRIYKNRGLWFAAKIIKFIFVFVNFVRFLLIFILFSTFNSLPEEPFFLQYIF